MAEYVRLGDVCTVISGSTPKSNIPEYWDGDVIWITPAELNESSYIIRDSIRHITTKAVSDTSLRSFPAGTVILSSRAPIGKTAIAGCEMYCNQGFKNLICSSRINNKYLYCFLSCKTDYLNSLGRGATFKEISKNIVEDIIIPLPEISKQKKIAAKFEHIRNVKQNYERQRELLDELIKSRFIEQFENKHYQFEKLGTVCRKITDGTHKTPTYLDEGVTFISAKNIVNGELDFVDIKHISEEEYQEIQKRCQTDIFDILLSKSGSLGSPVIVKTKEKLGLFESLAVIKYDRDRLLPEFLCEQLKTDRVQRQFKTGTKGVAIKHLHLGVIADTDIIVPPLDEQKTFAAFVSQVDKSKFVVQKSLQELETLKKSLMQQYFS